MEIIYLVTTDISYDGEVRETQMQAFSSNEKAKVFFDKKVAEESKYDAENNYDQYDRVNDSYTAWIDGEYTNFHTDIRIIKLRVDNPSEIL